MGRYLQIDGLPGGVVGPLDELVQKCKELARRRVSRVRVVLICGEQAKLEGQLERALEDITDLAARVDDLRVERDELKTALEAHLAETVPDLERTRKRLDEIDRMNERRIPRVITTDELREGQVAVLMSGGSIDAGGSVMNVEHEGDCVFVDFSRPEETFQVMADHTIVLLADAPEPESEVTAETIRASEPGSTWEDREGDIWEWDGDRLRWHRIGGGLNTSISAEEALEIWEPLSRSSVPPRGDYPKRLTVEDLDAAEVGSVLRLGCLTSKKREDGWGRLGASAEQMITASAIGWSRATLTPPVKPERRGEVISPEELREGDVVDTYGKGNFRRTGATVVGLDGPEGSPFLDGPPFTPRVLRGESWGEIRLIQRPEPELPTERGQHIRILAINGDSNIMPEEAVLIGDVWASLDGERDWLPGEITEWEQIRLVVEDGA